jgi:rubrerythrin
MNESNLVLIGVFPHIEAKSMVRKFKEHDIELILNHSKQNCTTGCEVSLEVLVSKEHVEKAIPILKEYQIKHMTEFENLINVEDMAFDLNQNDFTCPCCGTQFSPKNHKDCPDCGLCFA